MTNRSHKPDPNAAHNPGSRPAGAVDEATSAALVREMFDRIAPRYDLLNHVLSCNVDRTWWWRTARTFRHILERPDAKVLDICCGTGDMTRALLRRRPGGNEKQPAEPVIAADFSEKMLALARVKLAGRQVSIQSVDAMRMPFADGSLDLITTAFGFRNLPNYKAGLEEFLRVLKPGGEVGILDCSRPGGVLGKGFGFYFRHVLPAIGARISGDAVAYGYLPSSVEGFPPPPAMVELMRSVGFVDVQWTPYTFGIAGLWRGRKPPGFQSSPLSVQVG
ncbi:MAG TPA: ubiquinone/menaquinone biosynthesis methyltransferase [Acidobacteriaceae bacterium]|nr:ubiquinone/menaquinone biosynthesis methyltransferase [Acidobacteriaceae bacterium]